MTLPCVGCAMKDAFPLRGTTSFIFLVKKKKPSRRCQGIVKVRPIGNQSVSGWCHFSTANPQDLQWNVKVCEKVVFWVSFTAWQILTLQYCTSSRLPSLSVSIWPVGNDTHKSTFWRKKKKVVHCYFFFKWTQINPVCSCMCERHPDALFLILFKVLFILRN